jgi:hypothetical protein
MGYIVSDNTEKKCSHCGEVKSRSEFGIQKLNGKHYRWKAWCKACVAEAARVKLNKPGGSVAGLRARLKHNYGITVEFFYSMKQAQRGRCLICKNIFGADQKTKPYVDHDHRTGVVRGLLCMLCNVMLGSCREDGSILLAAYRYIQRGRQN